MMVNVVKIPYTDAMGQGLASSNVTRNWNDTTQFIHWEKSFSFTRKLCTKFDQISTQEGFGRWCLLSFEVFKRSATVDGSEIRRTHQLRWRISDYLKGLIHVRWFSRRISEPFEGWGAGCLGEVISSFYFYEDPWGFMIQFDGSHIFQMDWWKSTN